MSTSPQPTDLPSLAILTGAVDPPHADRHEHAGDPISGVEKFVVLLAVIIPFLGTIAAMVLLWGWGVTWVEFALMGAMYLVSVGGVTLGFHRYFTHKSFETPRFMQIVLAIAGSTAVQGPMIKWVAVHRRHHQHSDDDGDPHSPHLHGHGFWGMMKGIWHAHVGWLLRDDSANLQRYVPDLMQDKAFRFISKTFFLWTAIGLLIPAVLGGLITMSWTGALLGFIWGGLVRVFLAHHVTWSINSVCHIWGARPFNSHDQSTNNLVFGIIGLGEGWHNNHHAFPTSARHGLRWWQIDLTYYTIKLMSWVGLAKKVKIPTPELLAQKAK